MAWRVLLPIKNINFFPEKKLDKGIPRVYNSSRIQEMCAHSSADRVPGYEPVGRRFKSCWARQKRTHICLRQVWVLFWRSVPLPRNVKYASQVKCTSCAKCDFGTIGGGTLHFTSLHFTSCVSTILHSGSAAALLGEAKLHGILKKKTSYSTMFVQQEV